MLAVQEIYIGLDDDDVYMSEKRANRQSVFSNIL